MDIFQLIEEFSKTVLGSYTIKTLAGAVGGYIIIKYIIRKYLDAIETLKEEIYGKKDCEGLKTRMSRQEQKCRDMCESKKIRRKNER